MVPAGGICDPLGTCSSLFSMKRVKSVIFLCFQGFPDYHPPQHVIDKMKEIVGGDNPLHHQYTRSYVSSFHLYPLLLQFLLAFSPKLCIND